MDVFDQLAAEEKKIVPVQVLSAIPLTEDQVAKLEGKLSEKTGRSVKAQITVDPSLIGGVAVRIGDIVYDGSIVKQLGMIKRTPPTGYSWEDRGEAIMSIRPEEFSSHYQTAD